MTLLLIKKIPSHFLWTFYWGFECVKFCFLNSKLRVSFNSSLQNQIIHDKTVHWGSSFICISSRKKMFTHFELNAGVRSCACILGALISTLNILCCGTELHQLIFWTYNVFHLDPSCLNGLVYSESISLAFEGLHFVSKDIPFLLSIIYIRLRDLIYFPVIGTWRRQSNSVIFGLFSHLNRELTSVRKSEA